MLSEGKSKLRETPRFQAIKHVEKNSSEPKKGQNACN
jgi:hypothetical protein